MSAFLNFIGGLLLLCAMGALAVGSCILVWERDEARRAERLAKDQPEQERRAV